MIKTYILFDKHNNLYKIGKSKNIEQRLIKLCIDGVVPIKIFDEDVEAILHTEFAEQRTKHPLFIDGHTEWFKHGGKFADFISELEPDSPAFITPHAICKEFEAQGRFTYDSRSTMLAIESQDYYRYILGKKILLLLGYIYYYDGQYLSNHPGVKIDEKKLWVSTEVFEHVTTLHKIDLTMLKTDKVLSEIEGRVFVRLISRQNPIHLIVSELKTR